MVSQKMLDSTKGLVTHFQLKMPALAGNVRPTISYLSPANILTFWAT